MVSAFTEVMKWNMHDTLPKVKKPIKSIVAGRTTKYFPKEEYEKYFDAVYLEGLGHLLVWENPMTFNKALVETINELRKK